MDPWLETQLRLADRRGVLQGASLSHVQEYAVELLMLADLRDRLPRVTQQELDRMSGQPAVGAEPPSGVPSTPAERDELERWLAEHQGSVTGAELAQEWR
jgi:hypothetical protein